MKNKILAILLVISIAANIYFVFQGQPAQKDLLELKDRTNKLEKANVELNKQVNRVPIKAAPNLQSKRFYTIL